jgi:cytochrome c553
MKAFRSSLATCVTFGSFIFAVSQINAADFPEWAYPKNPPVTAFDSTTLKQVPGSKYQYTQSQIEDDFNPPDWFPEDHSAMPPIVAHGVPPAVKACAKCHISNGAGHPESSDLAGLPAAYFQRQMADLKNGNRKGARAGSMFPIAKAITDADVIAASTFYSTLKRTEWTKVIEAETVAKSYLGIGGMRFAVENGGSEPLGNRIIELPQAPERAELRDSRTGFIAYVPIGSIAKGRTLVMTGGEGKTTPCATCHGENLKGKDEIPHIIGRSPMYVFRQLNDVKAGTRTGPTSELMQQVVANLSADDMLAIAAYLAAEKP